MSVIEILTAYRTQLWEGLRVTLLLCAFVYPLGIVLGAMVGIARYRWRRLAGIPGLAFSLLMSSTPVIVLLFWLHYPLQYMLQIVVDPFITSVVALTAIMTAIVSDQVRTTLVDFPLQYSVAARMCGLTPRQTVVKIQLPIIARQILPQLLFAMVIVLQMTLFASMIGVTELFRVAQRINSDIYQPVEIYSTLAVFFIAVCAAMNILAYWLKSRFKWSFSEA